MLVIKNKSDLNNYLVDVDMADWVGSLYRGQCAQNLDNSSYPVDEFATLSARDVWEDLKNNEELFAGTILEINDTDAIDLIKNEGYNWNGELLM